MFISANNGGPQFWEVDLGDASQTIDRVIVSNRTDCCGQRLSNWLLTIYDNNKTPIWSNVYTDPPNPKTIIDISQANNRISNIKLEDYKQSEFNNRFYRVSATEYKSKLGRQGDCAEECHKSACEGEKKKWLGDYQCRDYRAGEFEEEERARAAVSIPEDAFTVVYRGKAYRILGGQNPKNGNSHNQGPASVIPSGWAIAPDNEDSRHVIRSYKWSTTGVIVDSGFAYYSQSSYTEPIFGRNFPHSMINRSGNTYSPNCGTCAILISRPSSIGDSDTTVVYNGNTYTTLSGWNKTDGNVTCQNQHYPGQQGFIPIPPGWRIADDNRDSIEVIKNNNWKTHVLVVSNGNSYGTATYTRGQPWSSNMLRQNGNTYMPGSCHLGILLIKNR
jgi:hypothetical protein